MNLLNAIPLLIGLILGPIRRSNPFLNPNRTERTENWFGKYSKKTEPDFPITLLRKALGSNKKDARIGCAYYYDESRNVGFNVHVRHPHTCTQTFEQTVFPGNHTGVARYDTAKTDSPGYVSLTP